MKHINTAMLPEKNKVHTLMKYLKLPVIFHRVQNLHVTLAPPAGDKHDDEGVLKQQRKRI